MIPAIKQNLKHMKSISYLFLLITILFCLAACAPSYVATEPTYVVVERPASPGTKHVWVDGDWVWNSRSHNYVWKNGHWATPYSGRTFVPGYWKSNHHGHYWVAGKWR